MAYHYLTEVWTEYAVGSLIIFLRLYIRARSGFRKWQLDDYLMLLAWAIYTVGATMRNETAKGSNILVGPDTPPDRMEALRTSMKFNFCIWVTNVLLFWTLKSCLLVLYNRILRNFMKKVVILACWFVALTGIGALLEVFLHCTPIWRTWIQWPVQPVHCQTGLMNFLVLGLLNLITDLVLFGIAVSVLFQVKLPTKQRIVVAITLCSGLLTIVACVLRNVAAYLVERGSTIGNFDGDQVLGWDSREVFTAVVIVNVPCLRPLVSSTKWISSTRSKSSRRNTGAGTGGSGDSTNPGRSTTKSSNSFFRKYSRGNLGLTTLGYTNYEADYDHDHDHDTEKQPSVAAVTVPKAAYSPDSTPKSKTTGVQDDIEAQRGTERHSAQPSHSEIMACLEKEMDKQGMQLHGILPS